jgi:hypothetical protein
MGNEGHVLLLGNGRGCDPGAAGTVLAFGPVPGEGVSAVVTYCPVPGVGATAVAVSVPGGGATAVAGSVPGA